MNFLLFFPLLVSLSRGRTFPTPKKAVIAIEMCMCGDVKWHRARDFASRLARMLDNVPDLVEYSIVQFAEDFTVTAFTAKDGNSVENRDFEAPEAFAGMSSNITAVS